MERGVEVLNDGAPSGSVPNGVVDLTGENKGPVVDLTGENDDANKGNVTLDENGNVIEEETKPELDAEGNPVKTEGEEQPGEKKDEQEGDEPVFYFGEQAVEVEVPAEISAALTEAGVDEKALLGELFAKDGKFELTKETREKLEAKFGKVMVDGYLTMYRGLNQQALDAHAKTQADATAAQGAMQKEYADLVGGKEGLEAMEAFILANFDEKQIGSYNAVMGGDNWEAQKMVIQMARQQMAQHDKLTKGDRNVDLLGDATPNASAPAGDLSGKTTLTSAEFNKIMDGDKYWTDRDYQRSVDQLRSQSINRGIR